MKKNFILILTLLSFTFPLTASEFVLSSALKINHSDSNQIAHTNDLVIFKYNDWSFTHEIVKPDNFIPSIDLTGFEHIFIGSVFEPGKRKTLPNWLKTLSLDLSDSLISKKENFRKINIGSATLYETYSSDNKQGTIFILEENIIHKLDVLGTNSNHEHIVSNIKKRN